MAEKFTVHCERRFDLLSLVKGLLFINLMIKFQSGTILMGLTRGGKIQRANIKEGSTPAQGLPYLFFLLFCFLFSCATTRNLPEPSTARMIENVPFFPQETYQCGPASLAGILSYWGVKVSPEDIAAQIYSRSAKGTLNLDIVLYARNKGLQAIQYRGSIKDLKKNIDLGYPAIILVDYGFWVYQQNHFMVIVGYNENGVIANSGRNRHKFIREEDFLRSWEKTDFWTLLIVPRQ